LANVVDWTVDKLLSGIRTLNARAESAQNTIRANRAAYTSAVRSLPSVPDVGAREALRAKLRDWIHRQVAVENRFNSFASNFMAAKAQTKRFLQSMDVTPPAYLGQVQIAIPAVVYGAIAVGLAVIATIMALNATQTRGIGVIRDLLATAKANSWTARETADALKQLESATTGTTPDPLGLSRVLSAALPILLVGGALFLFGPMLQRKLARA